MTSACRGHGSVLLQNEIYVIGGSIENVYNTTVSTVTVYDIDNDRWTSKASMNNAKAFFGV